MPDSRSQLPASFRRRLRTFPSIVETGLRVAQVRVVRNIETSLYDNRPHALIQMTTGAGKTFAAITSIYRLIKFGDASRVLFLVDRDNLGQQALKEFQQYVTPDDGCKFTELYNVQKLSSNKLDPVARVVITTIQRLYSMLKGEADLPSDAEAHGPWKQKAFIPAGFNERRCLSLMGLARRSYAVLSPHVVGAILRGNCAQTPCPQIKVCAFNSAARSGLGEHDGRAPEEQAENNHQKAECRCGQTTNGQCPSTIIVWRIARAANGNDATYDGPNPQGPTEITAKMHRQTDETQDERDDSYGIRRAAALLVICGSAWSS